MWEIRRGWKVPSRACLKQLSYWQCWVTLLLRRRTERTLWFLNSFQVGPCNLRRCSTFVSYLCSHQFTVKTVVRHRRLSHYFLALPGQRTKDLVHTCLEWEALRVKSVSAILFKKSAVCQLISGSRHTKSNVCLTWVISGKYLGFLGQ